MVREAHPDSKSQVLVFNFLEQACFEGYQNRAVSTGFCSVMSNFVTVFADQVLYFKSQ